MKETVSRRTGDGRRSRRTVVEVEERQRGTSGVAGRGDNKARGQNDTEIMSAIVFFFPPSIIRFY